MKDPYVVLGVEKISSEQDIKKAYKKLALEYHPDLFMQNQSSILSNISFVER